MDRENPHGVVGLAHRRFVGAHPAGGLAVHPLEHLGDRRAARLDERSRLVDDEAEPANGLPPVSRQRGELEDLEVADDCLQRADGPSRWRRAAIAAEAAEGRDHGIARGRDRRRASRLQAPPWRR